MIFRQLSKTLLPTLEKDLQKSLKLELQSAAKMADCMLAPTVYAFEPTVAGPCGRTAAREIRKVYKVEYPPLRKGLFQ